MRRRLLVGMVMFAGACGHSRGDVAVTGTWRPPTTVPATTQAPTTVASTAPVAAPVAPTTTATTLAPATTAAPTTTTTTETPAPPATRAPVPPADPMTVEAIIHEIFGDAGPAAVRVARCESSLNPAARNGSHAGLFQISRRWHEPRVNRLGFTWDQMYEPGPNTIVAHDIWAEQGWRPWTCRWAA